MLDYLHLGINQRVWEQLGLQVMHHLGGSILLNHAQMCVVSNAYPMEVVLVELLHTSSEADDLT